MDIALPFDETERRVMHDRIGDELKYFSGFRAVEGVRPFGTLRTTDAERKEKIDEKLSRRSSGYYREAISKMVEALILIPTKSGEESTCFKPEKKKLDSSSPDKERRDPQNDCLGVFEMATTH